MCGFIGSISENKLQIEKLLEVNKLIECRGPDQKKLISEKSDKLFSTQISLNIQLVFNRLAIIDLSDEASQPMISKTTNTGILFNGEIFNHRILKKELENKYNFKSSHSDTELLLYGLTEYGLKFLDRVIGQFAIVFFDFNNEKVYLIRDRLGQKPLFYSFNNNKLSFSSNLISLAKLNNNSDIDYQYIYQYLELGVIPSPNTLFKSIYKVKPGEVICFSLENSIKLFDKFLFWKIDQFLDNNKFDSREFIFMFNDAVKLREESDVPIAYFLSGGLDSTSVVKSAFDNSNGKQINTFSVISKDSFYDESKYSDLVAKKYQTNHFKIAIDNQLNIETVSKVISAYDELYFDPSVIPSYILSKEISKNFKVAISGDGGDELFGGYERISKILKEPSQLLNNLSKLYYLYPAQLGSGTNLSSNFSDPHKRYLSFYEDKKLMNLLDIKNNVQFFSLFDKKNLDYKNLLILDYNFYLSEMMMYKIDRASMANSVEVRSPFVDNRLVEYMFSHDLSYKSSNIKKPVLQNYLNQDFDLDFLNRPKKGFVINTSEWIYNNIGHLEDVFREGKLIFQMDKKIINKLSINKSRINGLRLWKLYFIERYFEINHI